MVYSVKFVFLHSCFYTFLFPLFDDDSMPRLLMEGGAIFARKVPSPAPPAQIEIYTRLEFVGRP